MSKVRLLTFLTQTYRAVTQARLLLKLKNIHCFCEIMFYMYYKNKINIRNRKFQIWQDDPKAVPVTDIRAPLPFSVTSNIKSIIL